MAKEKKDISFTMTTDIRTVARMMEMIDVRVPGLEIEELMYGYVSRYIIYANKVYTKEEKLDYLKKLFANPNSRIGMSTCKATANSIGTIVSDIGLEALVILFRNTGHGLIERFDGVHLACLGQSFKTENLIYEYFGRHVSKDMTVKMAKSAGGIAKLVPVLASESSEETFAAELTKQILTLIDVESAHS